MIGWFKIHGRLPGYNQVISKTRASRYEGARQKQDAESQIGWAIRRAMKEGHLEKVRVPVKIRFTWHESTSRRDLDNIFSGKKFILDALQNMRVLDGDGQKYVKGLSDEFVLDKVEEFIMVELEVAN